MTQHDAPLSPHRVIASRVRELRKGRSAAWLAEQMTARGVKWDRSIVANFENGRRAYVTVEELLTLADVLNVAPVYLLLPVDDEDAPVAFTPTRSAPTWQVREWIRGRMHIWPGPGREGQDGRLYHSQVPAVERTYPPKPTTPISKTETVPEPGSDDGER